MDVGDYGGAVGSGDGGWIESEDVCDEEVAGAGARLWEESLNGFGAAADL